MPVARGDLPAALTRRTSVAHRPTFRRVGQARAGAAGTCAGGRFSAPTDLVSMYHQIAPGQMSLRSESRSEFAAPNPPDVAGPGSGYLALDEQVREIGADHGYSVGQRGGGDEVEAEDEAAEGESQPSVVAGCVLRSGQGG